MRAACAGGALLAAVVVVAGWRPVELGEGVVLRWVRQSADHPWRTAVGGALLAGGLATLRRSD